MNREGRRRARQRPLGAVIEAVLVERIEPGSMICLQMPRDDLSMLATDAVAHMQTQIAEKVGHGEFILMVLRGEEGVIVAGPEKLCDTIAALSRNQLELLAERQAENP